MKERNKITESKNVKIWSTIELKRRKCIVAYRPVAKR
jgi:hypothetical protein